MLISRITNDVDALDQLISTGVVTLFSSTLTLVGVVVIMLVADVQLALVVFLTLPLLFIASLVFRIVAASAYRITRERIAEVTAYLQETLSGVRVVRSFAQEQRHVERMAELNELNRQANLKTVYLNASYFPAVELLSAIGTAVILLYGGYQALDLADRVRAGTRRSGSWSRSSATSPPSSTRSSSSPTSTRPTSRGWRRWTRSSTCSTPSRTWSTSRTRSTPGRCAARSRWRASGSPTGWTGPRG